MAASSAMSSALTDETNVSWVSSTRQLDKVKQAGFV